MVKPQPPGGHPAAGNSRPAPQPHLNPHPPHPHPPTSLFTERLGLATQQRTLDLFANTFHDVLASPDFAPTLQAIKKALFERAFARAFQDPEFHAVYAARWSPTRALCYAAVLFGINTFLAPILDPPKPPPPAAAAPEPPSPDPENRALALRVVCVGGGAAEIVALGAVLHQGHSAATGALSLGRGAPLHVDVTLADSGPWAQVVARLETALVTEPPLSKNASESERATNQPMITPSQMTTTFVQQDILDLDIAGLASILQGKQPSAPSAPMLITLLFTLNELFTSSGIGKTTTFLLNLTSVVPMGSLLLVVDSPGSYSETVVGKQAKKYPMHWLLDKILSETHQAPVEGRCWTKLVSDDGVWFRLAETLRYPIPLENMRYQVHLYRADDANTVPSV